MKSRLDVALLLGTFCVGAFLSPAWGAQEKGGFLPPKAKAEATPAKTAQPDEVPFVEGQPPPAAQNGEVWCLVTKGATYKRVTERVLVRPATFYYETIPPKYEAKEEQVLVTPEKKVAVPVPAVFRGEVEKRLVMPESTRYELVPAVFADEVEQVEVRPESAAYAVTPQTFSTNTERVLVEPARSEWVKVDCNDKGARIDRRESKDDCYTLVQIPARYETVTKQVLAKDLETPKLVEKGQSRALRVRKLVKDAEVKKLVVPAEYATVEKQVLVTAASVRFETTPPQYATVKKMVMVEPESRRKVEVPDKYEVVTHDVLDQSATLVWRRADAGKPVVAPKGDVVSRYGSIPGITSTDAQRLGR